MDEERSVPPSQCPQCGVHAAAGSDFCPNGHYLGWDRTQAGLPPAPADQLSQTGPIRQQHANTPLPPQEPQVQRQAVREDVAPNPVPAGPALTCQDCGELNALSRTYCQRCGERLAGQWQPAAQPQFLPPPPQRQHGPFPMRLVLTIVLAGALIVAGVVFALSRNGGNDPALASGKQTASPSGVASSAPHTGTGSPTSQPTGNGQHTSNDPPTGTMSRVDRTTMTAQATSTLPPNQQLHRAYGINNVLDGNLLTSWNSDGAKVGNGVGQVLTFHFQQPVHLARMDFLNGYYRSQQRYDDNGRLKGVRITTDAGSIDMTLKDLRAPQTLLHDFGVTSTVTITVTSIYPGAHFLDLALTEVAFLYVQN